MRDNESNPEGNWDEYRWERYLREHDARTDYYIRLLEDHLEDPEREVIIAEEMGWYHLLEQQSSLDDQARASLFFEEIEQLLEAEREQNEEALDQFRDEEDAEPGLDFEQEEEDEDFLSLFGEDADDEEADYEALGITGGGDDEDDEDEFTTHPLCDLAATYHAWLERLFLEENQLLNNPAAIRMAAYSAVCCAKLMAALEGDEFEDLGMTIAYLKRGLKAINTALGAYYDLRRQRNLPRKRLTDLHVRIFKIRDSIIELMGYYRQEWMRRIDD